MQYKLNFLPFKLFAIGLVGFVLLFGAASNVFAIDKCSEITTDWKTTDFSCEVVFEDAGGSGLKTCKYRVVGQLPVPDWTPVTCSGSGPVTAQVDAEVGATGNCQFQGTNACWIQMEVEDNSGNTNSESYFYKVDYTPPLVSANNASSEWFPSIDVTLSVSDVGDSGLAEKKYYWDDSTPSYAECIADGTTFNNNDVKSVSEGSHRLYLCAKDEAGNANIWNSGADQYKVDITPPTIVTFEVTSTLPVTVSNPTLNIDWEATDSQSGLKEVILYRKLSSEGSEKWLPHPDPDFATQVASGASDSGIFSETFDLDVEETYDYGIHVKDQANNECHENMDSCGNSVETITGVRVDTAAPGQPGDPTSTPIITSDTTPRWEWTEFTGDPLFYLVYWDTIAGGTTNSGSSLTNSFTHSDDDPLAEGVWYFKVKAFDNVWNESAFSNNGLVVIDTTAPVLSEISPVPFLGNDTTPNYTFNSTEAGTITYGGDCSSSTTAATAGNNTITFNELAEGPHNNCTIVVTDAATNPSAQLNVTPFIIDTIAPDTFINVGPANPTNSTSASFSFYSDDPSATFLCKLDSEESFTSPCTSYSGLLEGSYRFLVKAVDIATNKDQSAAFWDWKIDITNPKLDAFYPNREVLTIDNPTVKFSWEVRDSGGAGLDQVELFRRKLPAGWPGTALQTNTSPSGNGPVSGDFESDEPTIDGTYEYGIHVRDNTIVNSCDDSNCDGDYGAAGPIFIEVDKTRPPKPTCSPAGGEYQNKIKVECIDTEAGVNIYYTLDGSTPTMGSFYYDDEKFDITSTSTLKVAAWDTNGNRSADPDNSYDFTIIHNRDPKITSDCNNPGCDSPDPAAVNPITENNIITFSVDWTDADGDSVTFFVCKNDSTPSGGDCFGGSTNRWCRDTVLVAPETAADCVYTTQAVDEDTIPNDYYAFVCDDESACSSSEFGTFKVDATPPVVNTFETAEEDTPPNWINNTNTDATVSWSVLDQGGSNLKQIEVWRAFDNNPKNGVPDEAEWAEIVAARKTTGFSSPPSTDSDSYDDTPSTGVYWYGLHVVDNADNCINEAGTPCGEAGANDPQEVWVDKIGPPASFKVPPTPSNNSWHKSNISIYLDAKDYGGPNDDGAGSIDDLAECKYGVNGTFLPQTVCNQNLQVTIGSDSSNNCSIEGTNDPTEGLQYTCALNAYAIDHTGNETSFASRPTRLYGIDWTGPSISKVYVNELGEEPIVVSEGNVTYRVVANEYQNQTTSCNLYYKRPAGVSFIKGPAITEGLPCMRNCDLSLDYELPGAGDWQVRMSCRDQALNYNLWENTETSIHVETLSVTLSAGYDANNLETMSSTTALGSINTEFDMSSQIAGTAAGNANFKFDCTNDGWDYERDNIDLSVSDPGWIKRPGDGNTETRVIAPDNFMVRDLCQYPSASTYTANTQVERGISTATDSVQIQVSLNNPPEAINLNDNNDTAEYCFVSTPPIILSWQFSDLDPGDTQTAYQVQIGAIDTGKVLSTNTEYSPAGLSFNTTYNWQVKVWDEFDESPWAAGTPFTTPLNIYPFPDFTFGPPQFPSAEEEVPFTDQTTFVTGVKNWSWNFGDTETSSQQSPVHIYNENGVYEVTLTATDNAGSCEVQKNVNVTLPFPEWQEISPF